MNRCPRRGCHLEFAGITLAGGLAAPGPLHVLWPVDRLDADGPD